MGIFDVNLHYRLNFAVSAQKFNAGLVQSLIHRLNAPVSADENHEQIRDGTFHGDGKIFEVRFVDEWFCVAGRVISADFDCVKSVRRHDSTSVNAMFAVDFRRDAEIFINVVNRVENVAENFCIVIYVSAQKKSVRRVNLQAVVTRRLRTNRRRFEQFDDFGNIFVGQQINRHAIKFAVNREDRIDQRRLQKNFRAVSVNGVRQSFVLRNEFVAVKLRNAVNQRVMRRNGCNSRDDCRDASRRKFVICPKNFRRQISVVIASTKPRRRPKNSVAKFQPAQIRFVEDIFYVVTINKKSSPQKFLRRQMSVVYAIEFST